MDSIFHKTTSIFNVVKVARDEPRRYGKNGEQLINYDDTEEAAAHAERRRSSVPAHAGSDAGFGVSNLGDKKRTRNVEDVGDEKGSV